MGLATIVLPFLPMLPTQVLLNNFLYDLSQLTIPTDRVDPEYFSTPQKWDMAAIRRFMVFVLLHFFHAGQKEFRTDWIVESLATQTLLLLVIRTSRSPFRSRPSIALLATIVLIVATGLWLPHSPLAHSLEFTLLPASYFTFLCVATLFYLTFVEWTKLRIIKK